ncbi:MAG: VOC family protein [Candidatus Omnitrophica bacterium]|nr:VOC family protein [Candidatus Omnitrophota bacterium]MBU1996660.1 VOC family protein [Candidatus Omnitrophota bacterium]MBU4333226.1 VOC family protein [Candidatus Omnitrophota bacterium]
MKIGHVGISVSNLKRSIAFYKKHFDLDCVEKYHFKDKGMTIAILKKGDFILEFFEFKKFKPLPKYRKTLDADLSTVGVKHFSVEVDDIFKIFKNFKKARVPFEKEMQTFNNGAHYFFIKDPDGILIEIMSKP